VFLSSSVVRKEVFCCPNEFGRGSKGKKDQTFTETAMRTLTFICSLMLLAPIFGCESPEEESQDTVSSMDEGMPPTQGCVQPKIDFLWVIDNSSSGWAEQNVLAERFNSFTTSLQNTFDGQLDARMAVVNTNVLSDKGNFNQAPATSYPLACTPQIIKKCLTDNDCSPQARGLRGVSRFVSSKSWQCTWAHEDPTQLENPNGSINSRCLLSCTTDDDCMATFGDSTQCVTPPNGSGRCVATPRTTQCPTDVPDFIEMNPDFSNGEIFPCLSTVGVDTSHQANLEQGINAARFALDPTGPNGIQAQNFLRPDAWLVLIFISDEDDCSLSSDCLFAQDPEGQWDWKGAKAIMDCIKPEHYAQCSSLGDSLSQQSPGPLAPVHVTADFFRSLKDNPEQVLVASIVGDSQLRNYEDRVADIMSYQLSKNSPGPYAQRSYICSSDRRVADYGGRYIQLAENFGDQAMVANICGPVPCTTEMGQDGVLISEDDCEAIPAGLDRASYPLAKALEDVATLVSTNVQLCTP
jgi:hypothetical protein